MKGVRAARLDAARIVCGHKGCYDSQAASSSDLAAVAADGRLLAMPNWSKGARDVWRAGW